MSRLASEVCDLRPPASPAAVVLERSGVMI